MIRTSTATRRPGFTLVELMVSAAIVVIIMAILATAFTTGIDTMRQMRSAGDLMDQLRAAKEIINRDLRAPHFVSQDGKPNMGLRLSDQRADLYTTNPATNQWVTPRGGFFHIRSTPATVEGQDANGLQSTMTTGHLLHFPVVLQGGTDQNQFSGLIPAAGGIKYVSSAAEVAYFLAATAPLSMSNGNNTGSLPLYNLMRRQRLVALTDADVASFTPAFRPPSGVLDTPPTVANEVLSLRGGFPGWQMNRMTDLVDPNFRLGGGGFVPAPAINPTTPTVLTSGNRIGDDILLSNVISFEVRVSWVPGAGVAAPRPYPNGGTAVAQVTQGTDLGSATTDYPFDTLPSPFYFDTSVHQNPNNANSPLVPSQAIWVKALQIKVRVWDPKMKTARQMTLVVDM
jgi:prepilin-type N-terminal cleavage/methylation domain-containing protein